MLYNVISEGVFCVRNLQKYSVLAGLSDLWEGIDMAKNVTIKTKPTVNLDEVADVAKAAGGVAEPASGTYDKKNTTTTHNVSPEVSAHQAFLNDRSGLPEGMSAGDDIEWNGARNYSKSDKPKKKKGGFMRILSQVLQNIPIFGQIVAKWFGLDPESQAKKQQKKDELRRARAAAEKKQEKKDHDTVNLDGDEFQDVLTRAATDYDKNIKGWFDNITAKKEILEREQAEGKISPEGKKQLAEIQGSWDQLKRDHDIAKSTRDQMEKTVKAGGRDALATTANADFIRDGKVVSKICEEMETIHRSVCGGVKTTAIETERATETLRKGSV